MRKTGPRPKCTASAWKPLFSANGNIYSVKLREDCSFHWNTQVLTVRSACCLVFKEKKNKKKGHPILCLIILLTILCPNALCGISYQTVLTLFRNSFYLLKKIYLLVSGCLLSYIFLELNPFSNDCFLHLPLLL